jgi:hypothetical protein
MASEETAVSCPSPKKSKWDTFSAFCTQNPIGEFLLSVLSGITLLVGTHLLGHWNCFGLEGWYVQERRRREELKEKYETQYNEVYEKLQHIERTNADQTNSTKLTQDSLLSEIESLKKDVAQCSGTMSNLASRNMTCSGRCANQSESANSGGSPPEATVQVTIPDSEKSGEIVRIVHENNLGPSIESLKGSRILQEKVVLNDDILEKLHGLADACTKVDNRVTVQLDNFRVFIYTGKH